MATDDSDRSSPCSTTLLQMYSCIVDYSCRHRYLDVIYEVCRRHKESLSVLAVPHLRLASAGLYKMVAGSRVSEYPAALEIAEKLFTAAGSFDNLSLIRSYMKLMCGLKVKVLFHHLQSSPKQALILLRKYFPRSGDSFDKQLMSVNPPVAAEVQKASQDFRKSFLPLIGNQRRCENFMKTQYEALYGRHFTNCLARQAATFLVKLEEGLPDTFLDELLKTDAKPDCPANSQTLVSDVMLEMLLDCVEGKTILQPSDLLNLLDDLCPLASSSSQDSQSACAVSLPESGSVNSGNTNSQDYSSAGAENGSSDLSSSTECPWNSSDESLCVWLDSNCSSSLQEMRLTRSKSFVESRQSKAVQLSKRHPENMHQSAQDTSLLSSCQVKLQYWKTYKNSSGNKYSVFI